MRTIPTPKVNIDAAAPAPQFTSVMPLDLLDCDPAVALPTVAAIFSSPAVRDGHTYLVDEQTLAVRLLALYAAGACISLRSDDFRSLDGLAGKYVARSASAAKSDASSADETDAGEFNQGWSYASFVRRAACLRAGRDNRVGTEGLAPYDPLTGRGFEVMGVGLPAGFHDKCKSVQPEEQLRRMRLRLLTYAALFAAARPKACHTGAEALVMLALYAAGGRIDLGKRTFRFLERKAISFIQEMRDHFDADGDEPSVDEAGREQPHQKCINVDMAGYILHRAQDMARRQGVIGSGGSNEHAQS